MDKITKYYYINLSSRIDRNENILNEQKHSFFLKNKLIRYDAIDGKQLNLFQITNDILTNKGRNDIISNVVNNWGKDLTHGALGCALTHRELYKECLENKYNSLLILEDDIKINRDINFDFYLNEICKLDFDTFDILYLGCHHNPKKQNLHQSGGLFSQVTSNIYGTFAYLITQKGALNLLEKVFPISYQIDTHILQLIQKKQIKALITEPKLILDSHFRTDIQGKFGLVEKSKFINDYDIWNSVFENKKN